MYLNYKQILENFPLDPAYLVIEGHEELEFKSSPESLMKGKVRLIVDPYGRDSSFRCYYFTESAYTTFHGFRNTEYSYGIAIKI